MVYYAVIDTNVFISALLSKRADTATVRVLDAMFDGKIVPLYHEDILAEYDEVLHRSKFHFKEETIQQMIFFADIKQYMVNLELVKQNLDNEIEDILDYIESTNYNVAQGYKIYRMLRERRKQRKEVMQELSQLQALMAAFECEQMRKVYQNAIAKMQQVETEKRKSTVIQQLLEQEVS